MLDTPALDLLEVAASTAALAERAQTVLDVVVRTVPCDAAWLATADRGGGCTSRATAGTVLYRLGSCGELPGLEGDALLAEDSPLVAAARSCLRDGRTLSSFLWPLGGRHAPEGHTRVTVLAGRAEASTRVLGAVVLSPAGDRRGLTPRELEVMGLVVEGCSNAQIAQRLVLAPRTVAAHLEHVLCKLDAPTRTLAAVRADREGLYVPPALGAGPGAGPRA